MSKYPTVSVNQFEELGYDNVFFPYGDCFRNDRLVAFSHKTGNRIEIYNNLYPLKYNENTGKVIRFTTDEVRAIVAAKKEMGWISDIHITYLLRDKEEDYKDDLYSIR